MSPEVEALVKRIGDQGDKVRQLKSSGADKVRTDTIWNSVFIFVILYQIAVVLQNYLLRGPN